MKILIVFAVACSLLYCEAQVVVVDDSVAFNELGDSSPYSGISGCYGIPCPTGTVHCSTRSETSSDYTRWITTVECIDFYGNILNSAVKSSALASPPFYDGRYNYGSGGYYDDGSYYRGGNYQPQ